MLSKLKISEAQQMLGPKVPANALVHLKPVAAPVQEKASAAMRESIIIRDSEAESSTGQIEHRTWGRKTIHQRSMSLIFGSMLHIYLCVPLCAQG